MARTWRSIEAARGASEVAPRLPAPQGADRGTIEKALRWKITAYEEVNTSESHYLKTHFILETP